jgi:hypothetical protein
LHLLLLVLVVVRVAVVAGLSCTPEVVGYDLLDEEEADDAADDDQVGVHLGGVVGVVTLVPVVVRVMRVVMRMTLSSATKMWEGMEEDVSE